MALREVLQLRDRMFEGLPSGEFNLRLLPGLKARGDTDKGVLREIGLVSQEGVINIPVIMAVQRGLEDKTERLSVKFENYPGDMGDTMKFSLWIAPIEVGAGYTDAGEFLLCPFRKLKSTDWYISGVEPEDQFEALIKDGNIVGGLGIKMEHRRSAMAAGREANTVIGLEMPEGGSNFFDPKTGWLLPLDRRVDLSPESFKSEKKETVVFQSASQERPEDIGEGEGKEKAEKLIELWSENRRSFFDKVWDNCSGKVSLGVADLKVTAAQKVNKFKEMQSYKNWWGGYGDPTEVKVETKYITITVEGVNLESLKEGKVKRAKDDGERVEVIFYNGTKGVDDPRIFVTPAGGKKRELRKLIPNLDINSLSVKIAANLRSIEPEKQINHPAVILQEKARSKNPYKGWPGGRRRGGVKKGGRSRYHR